MLGSALSRHPDLVKFWEPFNVTVRPEPTENRVEELEQRLNEINWFDETKTSVFVLHFDQDAVWGVIDRVLGSDCKFICLRRANQLARHVSTQQAIQHSVWACDDPKYLPPVVEVEVDQSEYERDARYVERDWKAFREAVPETRRCDVVYEDLCLNQESTIKRICKFIGIEYVSGLSPTYIKLASKPISQVVPNFNDLYAKYGKDVFDPISSDCPAIRLRDTKPVGVGQHHSGWPFIMGRLSKFNAPNGVLLDDYIDRHFGIYSKNPGYKEPWYGIVHHPATLPGCLQEANTLSKIVDKLSWQESAPHCRGLICLSQHSAAQVEIITGIKTHSLFHPIGEPKYKFDWDEFSWSEEKRVVQCGFYCRNTLAIAQLPAVRPFIKTRLWDSSQRWIVAQELRLRKYYSGKRPYLGKIEQIERIGNDEYDRLLSSSVVFLEILAASANNVVLECIVRNTPIIVNRLPSVEEYLGKDYPLFYNTIGEAAQCLHPVRLKEAHDYLVAMDKSRFRVSRFVTDLFQIIRETI